MASKGVTVESLESRFLLHAGHDVGDGLSGEYFNNNDLSNSVLTRVDAQVNFQWGNLSPNPSIGGDTFSVRWTGQILAEHSETYTFYTRTDDGARLWVNGQLLIDKFKLQGPTEYGATIALQAGQKYDIKLEYFENTGGATAELRWSSASTPKAIIPQHNLFSSSAPATPPADPSDLQASAPAHNKVVLNWDDNSNNETGFEVQRFAGGTSWISLFTTGPGVTSYEDTSVSANPEYTYRVRATNDAGDSNFTASASATTPSAPVSGGTTLRIEAAGSSFTDSLGRVWAADNGFSGGTVSTGSYSVANTIDDRLYYTRRWGNFTYNLPVSNGAYELKLHFADPTMTSTNARLFDVFVEGSQVLNDYDIVADAGPKTAIVKSFNVDVSDGQLNLSFVKVKDNAILSAIELVPVDGEPAPTAPAAPSGLNASASAHNKVDLSWSDNSDNETKFIIERSLNGTTWSFLKEVGAGVTSTSDTTVNPSTQYFYRVIAANGVGNSSPSNVDSATTPAAPVSGGATIRIDTAGGPYTDSFGRVWSADNSVTGGTVSTGSYAVGNTTDDPLYYTRRWGNFNYAINLADGNYTLNLHFAEPVMTAVGKRKFDVFAEGTQILDDYDIFAEAGAKNAIVKSFLVSVTGGQLNLSFASVVDNAILSAIEIVPAAPPTSAPSAPSGLTAQAQSSSQVKLIWTDNANNESGFKIERKTGAGGAWQQIGTVGADVTTFTDSGRSPETTYFYRVRATNVAGDSGYSNESFVTTPAASNTFTQVNWTQVASNPQGRNEMQGTVVDGKLYAFGGFTGTGPVLRADYYNISTNTWHSLPDMPERITHAGVTVAGREIILAGGYIGTGSGFTQVFGSKKVHAFNVDTQQWRRLPDFPVERASGGLVYLDGKLHYFGGNNLNRSDTGTHYVLDLDGAATQWVTAPTMPEARSHFGYAAFNGKIYVFGGQVGHDENMTARNFVHEFDPQTNQWTAKAPMPQAISHHGNSTFVMGDRIIIAGGETSHNAGVSAVRAYNPATNTWESLTSLPVNRYSGLAGTDGDKIVFTGGSLSNRTYLGVPVL